MRRALLPALLVVLVTACAPARGRPASRATNAEIGAEAFDEREAEILRDLGAVDRRLAQRTRVMPSEDDLRRVTMAAVLREDPTLAVVDGAIDPFSFDARARGLAVAKQKIAALPANVARERASERDLLARLVDEEAARLEEERALPRSASSLVRAIVQTWRVPRSAAEAADTDRWLARRLAGVYDAMTASVDPATSLDVVRARELDDALDALERIAANPAFIRAMQELVRVREALESAASKPAAKAESEWGVIAARARAHLGTTESPDELARELAAAEADLRARTEAAVAAAGLGRDSLEASLEKQVFVSGPCLDAVPGSPVRSMAAPQEREPACHLRHLVAHADDDAARAIALAAMHDHVAVASWALDVARGAATIAETQGRHRLFVPVLPGTRARYERIALARPVAALGAGEAVRVLLAGDVYARATAWSSLGDVPLDVARRELGTSGAARVGRGAP
ncbi:MAG: hypothetical protein KF782_01185 [Labilithrix sp.]|nr:hypothetical protein [Labilithrix sp.]